MTTKEAIRAAILREPDTDLHRLALADWIDENEAGHLTCHICGGKGGWMSQYHKAGVEPYWCGCATCDSTGLEPDDAGFRAKGIRWMVANPQNSWVCLCKGSSEVPCRCCKTMGDEIKDIPRRRDGETHYVIRRGMVEEVRLSFAQWYGGECSRCDGGGELIGADRPFEYGVGDKALECPDCNGSGEISAIGPELVRQHPIKNLVILDKRPALTSWNPERWTWFGPHPVTRAPEPDVSRLPGHIWQMIRRVDYPSKAEADKELIRALLIWANNTQPS